MYCITKFKYINNLPKNPIKGGNPINEKKTKDIKNRNIKLKFKIDKSYNLLISKKLFFLTIKKNQKKIKIENI